MCAPNQHLRAYGSTKDLNQTCVDNRFKYVERGCSIYVEWLGIPNNPKNKGWAAADGYGVDIVKDGSENEKSVNVEK